MRVAGYYPPDSSTYDFSHVGADGGLVIKQADMVKKRVKG